MRPNDKQALIALISDVHAYYRQPVSQFVLQVWINACENFELEQVSKAMTAHVTDPELGKFCPKVADMVRILSGTKSDRSQLAWAKLHDAMGTVGGNSDVVFDDSAIHAVVQDMGGWPKICAGEIKDLSYTQHQFCKAHQAYLNLGKFDYPRKLLGRLSDDAGFVKKGLPPPAPYFIGNQTKCQNVLNGGVFGGKTAITNTINLPAHLLLGAVK
jgi:hypothetical protein